MTDKLMPDFVETLERRLRGAAAIPHSEEPELGSRSSGQWLPRLVLPAMAVVALAALILTLSASDNRHTPKAYGKPLILQTPPVDATKVMQELQDGISVKLVLGPDARLTAARPVPAFGGTAYVVTGDKGWCLTAPDPAAGDQSTADPARRGGVTCARTDAVYKYGISLGIGDNVIAAVPQGVKNPTLKAPDGTLSDLQPSNQGVVAASNVQHGSVLTLYAVGGAERSLHLP